MDSISASARIAMMFRQQASACVSIVSGITPFRQHADFSPRCRAAESPRAPQRHGCKSRPGGDGRWSVADIRRGPSNLDGTSENKRLIRANAFSPGTAGRLAKCQRDHRNKSGAAPLTTPYWGLNEQSSGANLATCPITGLSTALRPITVVCRCNRQRRRRAVRGHRTKPIQKPTLATGEIEWGKILYWAMSLW